MSRELSVLMPSRNEEFLSNTIEDILKNSRGDTEVIAVCDGAWPVNGIEDNPKVTLIYNATAIGQRAATNQAARISRAKFVMKADAHCAFDEGFDVKLMENCEPNWTVIPQMYNLHAFDWKCPQCGHREYQGAVPVTCGKCEYMGDFEKIIVWKRRENRHTEFWRFDNNLKFQYWRAYNKRPEAQTDIADTMSSIGACFFMHRKRYWELEGLDERHGSWGQVGTEVACKSWLSGGRQVVNKKTWFAHMFRTGKGFSFPYRLSGKQVNRAREYSKKLWLGNNWPKAKHDLNWLIQRFAPVPDWDVPVITHSKTVGLVYYTDNHGDPFLLETCRKQIKNCVSKCGIEKLVCVSQKPVKDFGQNIVMDLKRAVLSIFKQILEGVKNCQADIIYLLEHDLLYHPDHFSFMPPENCFYYDRNRWSVCDKTGKAVFYHTNVPSMMCAPRDLLIKHYQKVVDFVEKNGWKGRYGYSPPKGLPKEQRIGRYKCYFSENPSIDIRRDDAFTRKRMDKSQFRSERSCRGWTEADEVPGWGKTRNRFTEFLQGINNG